MMNQAEEVVKWLERHGLRVSEVLRMRVENIIDDNRVFISGSKQSHDRFIVDPLMVSYARARAKGATTGKIYRLTYDQIYYYMKKNNLGMLMEKRKNNRITHAPRARKIRKLVADGLSLTDVRDEIGHKKTESTRMYL